VLVPILADAEGVAFVTGGATVIAALVLGGLAAWTADHRLKQQIADSGTRQERELAQAGDRQKKELDAEAERQTATLTHARELADLADLRSVLDDATLAIHNATEARIKATTWLHGRPGATDEELVERSESAEQVLDEARALVGPVLARLEVRLGSDDPITQLFDSIDSRLLDMATSALLLRRTSGEEGEAQRVEFDREVSEFDKAARAFPDAVVERVGAAVMAGWPTRTGA
jgi:hypothetical protein